MDNCINVRTVFSYVFFFCFGSYFIRILWQYLLIKHIRVGLIILWWIIIIAYLRFHREDSSMLKWYIIGRTAFRFYATIHICYIYISIYFFIQYLYHYSYKIFIEKLSFHLQFRDLEGPSCNFQKDMENLPLKWWSIM